MLIKPLAGPFCIALFLGIAGWTGVVAGPVRAQDVRITESMARAEFALNGRPVVIERNQDPKAVVDPEFSKTSRACPPFCIHPMQAAPGVTTLGELEVIEFLRSKVGTGAGILMDSRLPEWNAKGTIPGAINVPFATLAPNNPYRDEILQALGARPLSNGALDFSQVLDVALFCNGPWCDQSPRAIRYLLEAGFPPDKLFYYRGGMQNWLLLGLTVVKPIEQG